MLGRRSPSTQKLKREQCESSCSSTPVSSRVLTPCKAEGGLASDPGLRSLLHLLSNRQDQYRYYPCIRSGPGSRTQHREQVQSNQCHRLHPPHHIWFVMSPSAINMNACSDLSTHRQTFRQTCLCAGPALALSSRSLASDGESSPCALDSSRTGNLSWPYGSFWDCSKPLFNQRRCISLVCGILGRRFRQRSHFGTACKSRDRGTSTRQSADSLPKAVSSEMPSLVSWPMASLR